MNDELIKKIALDFYNHYHSFSSLDVNEEFDKWWAGNEHKYRQCDDEPYRNITMKLESQESWTDRILKNALFKIKSKPLAPYELQEVVIHILDRLDQKNIKEQ